MPTRGVEFGPRTMELLNTDQAGRIRLPEVKAAVRWATGAFKGDGQDAANKC